jgi:CRISPR-associated protein Cst1
MREEFAEKTTALDAAYGVDSKSDKITVKLDTALFNAGVLGFIDVLEKGGIDCEKNGDELIFDGQALAKADIAEIYLEAVVEKFKKSTKIYRVITSADGLVEKPDAEIFIDEESKKDFLKRAKDFSEPFWGNAIKTGLQTLNDNGTHNDIFKNAEALKKTTNIGEAKELIKKIRDDFFSVPVVAQTLYMKAIIYTKINMIWEGIAFSNRAEAKAPVKDSFKRVFADPLQTLLTSDNGGKTACVCCGNRRGGLDSLSFLNDTGIDAKRKKSPFWNMRFNLEVCPLCRFIYTCAPIGFNQIGQDLVFVNRNKSLEDLIGSNAKLSIEEEVNYRYKIINDLILNEVEVKRNEISNIEVLIRHGGDKCYYSLDIIDKRTIRIFERCKYDLGAIKFNKAKIDEKIYINIAEEAIGCLFSKRALWSLILGLIRAEYAGHALWRLLMIQIKREEDFKMENPNVKRRIGILNTMWKEGSTLKQLYNDGDKNSNKFKSTIIKMQNMLRLENRDDFFDILFRLYGGITRDIPDAFLDAMKSDKAFKEIGVAFILGALGTPYKKEENTAADGEKDS